MNLRNPCIVLVESYISKVTSAGRLPLPKRLRKALGLKDSEYVEMALLGKTVVIRRLRVDNMPAYMGEAFLRHARLLGFRVEHIQKSTPEDNGAVESFHAGLARDYLNALVFDSFAEAEAYVAWAREDYNTVEPMQRLKWRTPRKHYEEVTASAN